MSTPLHQRLANCELTGAERLAPGGAAALCAEIQRAIEAHAPGTHYQIVINVLSSSRLAAKPVVNGKTIATQNFAVMDGKLNEASIKHFAAAVAAAVEQASRP